MTCVNAADLHRWSRGFCAFWKIGTNRDALLYRVIVCGQWESEGRDEFKLNTCWSFFLILSKNAFYIRSSISLYFNSNLQCHTVNLRVSLTVSAYLHDEKRGPHSFMCRENIMDVHTGAFCHMKCRVEINITMIWRHFFSYRCFLRHGRCMQSQCSLKIHLLNCSFPLGDH